MPIRDQVISTGRLPDQGVVITVDIPPTVSHFATHPAYLYLPPAWFAKVTPSLPTLVLLPGEPGSASDWSNDGDADNTADAFAQGHHGEAPIIVMPDPNGVRTVDSECVNSQFGNAETYLVDDVPAFVRHEFSASRAAGLAGHRRVVRRRHLLGDVGPASPHRVPDLRLLFGIRLAPVPGGLAGPDHRHPVPRFASDFAAHDPNQLLDGGHFPGLAGWFEVGNQDTEPLEAAQTSNRPPSGPVSPPASWFGRAATTSICGARPSPTPFHGWPGGWGSLTEPAHEPSTCESP